MRNFPRRLKENSSNTFSLLTERIGMHDLIFIRCERHLLYSVKDLRFHVSACKSLSRAVGWMECSGRVFPSSLCLGRRNKVRKAHSRWWEEKLLSCRRKKVLRAFSAKFSNFFIIWIMNSNFYLLTIYFFKYTSNKLSISFKYYFFIHSLFIFYFFLNNYTSSNIFLFNTRLLL